MSNHLDSPLVLTYSEQLLVGYKVNKSGNQSGKYVDKEIVVAMMCALHNALLDIRKINKQLIEEGKHGYVLMENEVQAAIDLSVGR
jgi:hypothetical protein